MALLELTLLSHCKNEVLKKSNLYFIVHFYNVDWMCQDRQQICGSPR